MPTAEPKRRWFHLSPDRFVDLIASRDLPALAVGSIPVVRLQSPQGLDGADRRGGGWRGGPRHAALVGRWLDLRLAISIRHPVAAWRSVWPARLRSVGWPWKGNGLDGKRRWLSGSGVRSGWRFMIGKSMRTTIQSAIPNRQDQRWLRKMLGDDFFSTVVAGSTSFRTEDHGRWAGTPQGFDPTPSSWTSATPRSRTLGWNTSKV